MENRFHEDVVARIAEILDEVSLGNNAPVTRMRLRERLLKEIRSMAIDGLISNPIPIFDVRGDVGQLKVIAANEPAEAILFEVERLAKMN